MSWLQRLLGIGPEADRDQRLDQLEKEADESQAEITQLIKRMNGEDEVRSRRAIADFERIDAARAARRRREQAE